MYLMVVIHNAATESMWKAIYIVGLGKVQQGEVASLGSSKAGRRRKQRRSWQRDPKLLRHKIQFKVIFLFFRQRNHI